jgi:hypothetical protein
MLTSHLFGAIRFWRTEALAEDLDAADADGSSEEAEAELGSPWCGGFPNEGGAVG